ncbi:MAG: calcium-binding protein, partial [Candidatus Zixiibacteriota bacterium]
MQATSTSNYDDERVSILTAFEGDVAWAYLDSEEIVTFGVGLNLRVHGELVLDALGFDFGGQYLAGAALTAERRYGFEFVVNRFPRQNYTGGASATNTAKTTFDAELQRRAQDAVFLTYDANNFVSYDAYLQFRAKLVQTTEFRIDDPRVRANLMAQVLDGYTVFNVNGSSKNFTGYEDQLDTWLLTADPVLLTAPADTVPALLSKDNTDRLALLSLAFNNAGELLGPNLRNALVTNNRAEAWYEIRYGSNRGQEIGVAKRRYFEAELFGLYDDPLNVTESEAYQVYRMLQSHRDNILWYEAEFGLMPDGQTRGQQQTSAGLTGLELANHSSMPLALLDDNRVDSVAQCFEPAKRALIATLNAEYSIGLNPDGYLSTSIFLDPSNPADHPNNRAVLDAVAGRWTEGNENDILIGLGGGDTLKGGIGEDVLIGGTGNDRLEGGQGDDLYAFRPGDGNDTVVDSDGSGKIIVSGLELTGVDLDAYQGSGADTWVDAATLFKYQRVGKDLVISEGTLAAGDKITVKDFDFQTGALGIHLNTKIKVAIQERSGNFFMGSEVQYSTGSTTIGESLGKPFTVSLNMAAQTGDRIVLEMAGGDAGVWSAVTGDEVVSFAGGSVELMLREGQTEISFALINTGDVDSEVAYTLNAMLLPFDPDAQQVSADYHIELQGNDETDIPFDSTNTLLGDQAPLLDGSGNIQYDAWDNIISSGPEPGRADVIHDTSGNDTILAGGGDDIVWRQRGGDDIIDLGDGDDDFYTVAGTGGRVHVRGGAGNDYLGAGAGRDVIEGGEGADGLYGSAEDDEIYGDEKGEAAAFIAQGRSEAGSGLRGEWVDAEAGSDRVFTGSGNDLIAGGDGDDLIVAGGGDDQIWGDWNTWSPTDEWRSWSVSEDVQEDAQGNKTYSYDVAHIYSESTTGTGNDTIHAGGGNDVARGEGGDDTLFMDDGDDKAWGGEGDDVMLGGAGGDLLIGDDTTDVLAASLHGSDFLDGGEGDDQLFGMGNADSLFGGAGNDQLYGDSENENAGDDYLDGEDGDDYLIGAGGSDTLFGGRGHDELYGDGSGVADELLGSDTLDGGDGDDILVGGGNNDVLLGGDGDDELAGDSGDTAEERHGDDYLDGGNGNDVLIGGGGSDLLIGGTGADQLFGDEDGVSAEFSGDDRLDGGDGDDVLVGGAGNDNLMGGADNDQLFGDGAGMAASDHGNDWLDGG